MPIAYSDGSEEEILSILRNATDLSSTSVTAHERYSVWPIRYHLCPERSNLLRHLDFAGLDVLELGAGLGAVSRFIAENARSFVAVEGTEIRTQCLRARLRDMEGWEAAVANIQDYRTDRRFDAVCLIGVLEYSDVYLDPPDGSSPFEWLLRHAAGFLKPGGSLIVAIENQFGVKYWAGAAEDHTGRMFDGVIGYPPGRSPRTFSRHALRALLAKAGLTEVEEFYPWPDYKTPTTVIGRTLVERFPDLAGDMAADAVAHEQAQQSTYFPWAPAIAEAASGGLLGELSNSFLFVAKTAGSSPADTGLLRRLKDQGECAWHYASMRKEPICTFFARDASPDAAPIVCKRAFGAETAPVYATVRRKAVDPTPALLGHPVLAELRKRARADDRQGFARELERFLRWAIGLNASGGGALAPRVLDLVTSNAVKTGESYETFDLEWEALEPIPPSWFVLRNLFVARDAVALFPTPPAPSMAAFHAELCAALGVAPDLDRDIDREARMQDDVQRNVTFDTARASLRTVFGDRLTPAPYPRDPSVESRRRGLRQPGPSVAKRIGRLIKSPRALAGAIARRLRSK